MRFAFVDAEKAKYPVGVLCHTLAVSRSGYYRWKTRSRPLRARQDEQLCVEIAAAHRRSRGTYGSPRIHRDLKAKGVRVGRKRVERLMRQRGLQGVPKKRFRVTTDSRHDLPVAANLLGRRFTAARADTAWVADITYVWTGEGWLYLAVLLDLFSRRVVGWAIRDTIDTPLVTQALDMALRARRPQPGWLHHSDRGCQYASHAYQARLKSAGALPSMSRVGDCWDNAVAESFFATIKRELIDVARFQTRDSAARQICDYIETFYNRHRRHSSLDYRSPVEHELRSQNLQSAA